MLEETQVSSLAHKISFAVFRVVRLTKNRKLRDELEAASVDLVRDLTGEKIGILDRLIALAEAVGEMNEVNSEVLRRELRNLYEIVSFEKTKSVSEKGEVYVGDIFRSETGKKRASASHRPTSHSISIGAKERHSAILEFIRQFPSDCRMKNLSERFVDVSERTLRSDIGVLIEGGQIERLGGKSGPSSYFVAVDKSVSNGEKAITDPAQERILLPEATRF